MKPPLKGSELLWIWSGAPWIWASLPDDGSSAGQVHRFFRRHNWDGRGRAGHLLMAAVFVAGIPAVLGMIAVLTARHGERVRNEEGKGPARQAREQLLLWLTQGVLPLSYYLFELYRGTKRVGALDYVYRHETKSGLYPLLRARFASAETTLALQDKALFARHCQAHGVPVVPALFVVDRGVITRFDGAGSGLPHCDVFLKPLSGSGGKGAAVWSYVGEGRYRNAAVGIVDEARLLNDLLTLSRREAYVGRAYVANHPHLAEVSSGALCSIRVVSCLDEHN
jgi:Sugar-transfer associated ATP-grasp